MRTHSSRGFARDRGPRAEAYGRSGRAAREWGDRRPGDDASGGPAVDLSDLVLFLARQLAEHPDEVEVSVQDGPQTLYELRVAGEDQGRIIGREGRTIQALRVLVGAAARRHGGRATVELREG